MFDRRQFLSGVLAFAASFNNEDRALAKEITKATEAIVAPSGRPDEVKKALLSSPVGMDRVWLIRDTKEEIISVYRTPDGTMINDQLLLLSWFFRDVRDHSVAVHISPRLFAILSKIQTSLSEIAGKPTPLVLSSGYRTPQHNARIEGAARNSMHLYGRAADLKMPGFLPSAIATAASFCDAGGIGLYPTFVHVDVGILRTWGVQRQAKGART